MAQPFIGRKKELEILQKTLQSDEAEMVAIIGRRRVGKTFLGLHKNEHSIGLIDSEVTMDDLFVAV